MKTDEGGWTLITDIEERRFSNGTVEIDDKAMNYKDILWVAKDRYYMDLNYDWDHDWDFNGWNLEINMLKFNSTTFNPIKII